MNLKVPIFGNSVPAETPAVTIPRVIVATTAMLTFISFWRAAAIVLNDLASSAYYAGGEAEAFHRQNSAVVHSGSHAASATACASFTSRAAACSCAAVSTAW